MSQFETASFSGDGSGERPTLVTEQFALEKSRGNRGAIHSYEWPVATGTPVVDGVGDEFLAGPCLTQNENRGISWSHDFDIPDCSLERSAPADNLFKLVLGPDLFSQVERFLGTLAIPVDRSVKAREVAAHAGGFRKAALHVLELEAPKCAWFGAGETQNADLAVGDHQGDPAEGSNACFQQGPGKLRKTRFCLGVDRDRLLTFPNPIRYRIGHRKIDPALELGRNFGRQRMQTYGLVDRFISPNHRALNS